jgi:hypothetical protein
MTAVPAVRRHDREGERAEPVRLVIGWRTYDQGVVTPLLAGGRPGGTPWTGPVFSEETLARAEHMANQIVTEGPFQGPGGARAGRPRLA